MDIGFLVGVMLRPLVTALDPEIVTEARIDHTEGAGPQIHGVGILLAFLCTGESST